MKLTQLLLPFLLAACAAPPTQAARRSIELAAPWPSHVIAPGPGGADGVSLADADGDGDLDVAAAWEQGNRATVSLQPEPELVRDPWPTVVVATAPGAEDASWGDLDLDGRLDVAIACESGKRLIVAYAPTPEHLLEPAAWSATTIAAATNVQRWMRVVVADLDADGRPDLLAGGKVSPATVGWLPGPAAPRAPLAWTYAPLGPAAWVMSLEPWDADADGDLDLLLSDRTYQTVAGGRDYSLMGSRWLEAPGWSNHPIGPIAGDAKMLRRDGQDRIVDGRSSPTLGNRIAIKTRTSSTWNTEIIDAPTGVGEYQAAAIGDLDLDGLDDIVLTFSAADGDLSGVIWLRAPDWSRGEIAGAPGAKYDNAELADLDGDGDLDVVTSEQHDELGIVWYENPAAVDGGDPDAGSPDAHAPGCDAAA